MLFSNAQPSPSMLKIPLISPFKLFSQLVTAFKEWSWKYFPPTTILLIGTNISFNSDKYFCQFSVWMLSEFLLSDEMMIFWRCLLPPTGWCATPLSYDWHQLKTKQASQNIWKKPTLEFINKSSQSQVFWTFSIRWYTVSVYNYYIKQKHIFKILWIFFETWPKI